MSSAKNLKISNVVFSVAGDEDSDVDIPEDEGSDSDIDDGQQIRPNLTRHAHLSGDAWIIIWFKDPFKNFLKD